ncbi:MAG TPA: cytochrome c [Vicinamibacterales bacterium]|nr:cytochrome c [Vicinamibacterales bacterium]
MRARWLVTISAVSALVVGWQAAGLARPADGTQPRIWDGVYTSAQAEHGKDRFTAVCRRCHSDDLNGSDRGPSLRGDHFMMDWDTQDLASLFAKIRNGMPPDAPASLSDDDYLDVVTYILQANKYPAGDRTLKRTALDAIVITRSADAPEEVRNFRMVRVVGCLAQVDNAWVLTNTGEPALTNEQPPTSAALQDAAGQPLGTHVFRLVSVSTFHPADHAGQKMEARGLIYRAPDKSLINVTSLDAVGGSGCGS